MTVPALAVLGRGLVDPAAPVLRADDAGVQHGDGVFETVRIAAGRAFKLDRHLERLRRGAATLALAAPDDGEWRALAALAVSASGAGDGVLKLVCTRGPEGGPVTAFASVRPIPEKALRARAEGVAVVTLPLGVAAGAGAPLAGVKSTSYAANLAALREAAARGAGDAIWLALGGEVLDAPTSTVCWVAGGALRTPPATAGVLPGTTVAVLAALAAPLRFEAVAGTVADLRAADEVLLVSSVRGVAGVRSIDGVPVGDGGLGPHTVRLRDAFEDVAAGRRDVPGLS